MIFESKPLRGNLKIEVQVAAYELIFCASCTSMPKTKQILQVRWSKPEPGWVKLNSRGVHSLVSAVFFQIYHQTDRDRFSHNQNRCTPTMIGFPTYNSVVFCGQFHWFNRFEIFKKKLLIITQSQLGPTITII